MAEIKHTPTKDDTRDPWSRHVEDVKGHTLRRNADGDVDIWVVDVGHHNGPGCIACGEDWCCHCTRAEEVRPCPGGDEKRARDEAEAARKRLSDAAPDLLEALKRISEATPENTNSDTIARFQSWVRAVANTAILKAEGQSNG